DRRSLRGVEGDRRRLHDRQRRHDRRRGRDCQGMSVSADRWESRGSSARGIRAESVTTFRSDPRSASMARFLFVYRSTGDSYAALSPERRQQLTQKWGEWIGAAMQKGWMLDPGDALTEEGRVVNATLVTDGPFVESKEVVGGFSIVEADSLDAAAE